MKIIDKEIECLEDIPRIMFDDGYKINPDIFVFKKCFTDNKLEYVDFVIEIKEVMNDCVIIKLTLSDNTKEYFINTNHGNEGSQAWWNNIINNVCGVIIDFTILNINNELN